MFLDLLLNHPNIQALGWALAHFIWQGTLLAAVLALAKILLHSYSANLRYTISCITLSLMLLIVVGSFLYSSKFASYNPNLIKLNLPWSDNDWSFVHFKTS